MTYDAILFDFDGVLADTEPLHWQCWAQALRPLNICLDRATYDAHCIGVADRELMGFFASLAPQTLAPGALGKCYAEKRQLYGRLLTGMELLTANTVKAIKSLDTYRLGIVTSSHYCDIAPALERAGLRSLFGVVVSADDAVRRKPAPDPYLAAAARLDATRPLVIEDSEPGVASARAAGFDVIRLERPSDLADALRPLLKPEFK